MAATSTSPRRAGASSATASTAPHVSPGEPADYLKILKRYSELFHEREAESYACRFWQWAAGALPRELRASIGKERKALGAREDAARREAMVG
jgi:hypothetical protein